MRETVSCLSLVLVLVLVLEKGLVYITDCGTNEHAQSV